MAKPIAILLSDIHLCHSVPAARCAEPDWYAAMERTLQQIRKMAMELDCLVLCAGDVFDKWNANPELVNWAITHLPKMVSIPGQHDLPHHSQEDIDKSAYMTLVHAGVITNHPAGRVISFDDRKLRVHMFPWGSDVKSIEKIDDGFLNVALVHSYVWVKDHVYPGAAQEQELVKWRKRLEGYDVAVFGDNHSGFLSSVGDCIVVNCGCLIQRKQNEREYVPTIGFLYSNGSIVFKDVGIEEDDLWVDPVISVSTTDMSSFLEEVQKLSSDSLDFTDAINKGLIDLDGGVKKVVIQVMEDM